MRCVSLWTTLKERQVPLCFKFSVILMFCGCGCSPWQGEIEIVSEFGLLLAQVERVAMFSIVGRIRHLFLPTTTSDDHRGYMLHCVLPFCLRRACLHIMEHGQPPAYGAVSSCIERIGAQYFSPLRNTSYITLEFRQQYVPVRWWLCMLLKSVQGAMGTLTANARTCPTYTCRVEVVRYFSEADIQQKTFIVIVQVRGKILGLQPPYETWHENQSVGIISITEVGGIPYRVTQSSGEQPSLLYSCRQRDCNCGLPCLEL